MSKERKTHFSPDTPIRWQPLLQDELAKRATCHINEIAEHLARLTEQPLPLGEFGRGDSAAEQSEALSLSGDAAGIALFFSYLHQARPDNDFDRTAEKFLDRAMDLVSRFPMGPALYGGFSGIGWVISHLDGRFAEPQEGDPAEEIDSFLLKLLNTTPWLGDYDLINGLVGYGVYALERLPRPSAAACLEKVVERLSENAERTADGITWFTRPELLPAHQREQFPDGYYNLGLAHGMPGIIALLGAANVSGVAVEKSREMLNGAVAWLMRQRLPAGLDSYFPTIVNTGDEPAPSRLAWCYGDGGIMASLLFAARCTGENAWANFALEIAKHAAERDLGSAKVVDAPLCHGAVGVAHIFNRLFHASGEERLAQAARFWYGHTLDLHRRGEGLAGFASFVNGEWTGHPGFLTGAAGIGLALLGATTPIEPAWDRLLLVGIPPEQAPGG